MICVGTPPLSTGWTTTPAHGDPSSSTSNDADGGPPPPHAPVSAHNEEEEIMLLLVACTPKETPSFGAASRPRLNEVEEDILLLVLACTARRGPHEVLQQAVSNAEDDSDGGGALVELRPGTNTNAVAGIIC